ncbi:hypothetical protein DYBT9275_01947 [Dyadobacter sp. CECT 9275]|uniref:YCII-related domain-containing protein n=1 Tax=Dyadobacter helix TaxID=2822344 RepID=A0A916J9X9_9BACT|nr:YciI family protein [Dyadobacter sp. CECT 9275]CAG4998182.1 hypothetical protein DYBT9275_01947 [Dyadobacter sp. CECT 9275]
MEKFLLLIREDMEQLKQMPQQEFDECIRVMTIWVEELAQTDNYVAAEPLMTEGRYVSRDNIISDGPFIEAKEAISGYFIIRAENLDQAASIAQSCPQIIANKCFIEVRPIMETGE